MTSEKRQTVEAALKNLETRIGETLGESLRVQEAIERSGALEHEPGLAGRVRKLMFAIDDLTGNPATGNVRGLAQVREAWRSACAMADRELAGQREKLVTGPCACGVTDCRPTEVDRVAKGGSLRLHLQCRACDDTWTQYFDPRETAIGWDLELLLGDEAGILDLPDEPIAVRLEWAECTADAEHPEYLHRAICTGPAAVLMLARAPLTVGEIKERGCHACALDEAHEEAKQIAVERVEHGIDEPEPELVGNCRRCMAITPEADGHEGSGLCSRCVTAEKTATTTEKPCLKCLVGEAKGRGRYCAACEEFPHCPNCGELYDDIGEKNPQGYKGCGLCERCHEAVTAELNPL